jgi:hypothetical protein
MRWIINAYVDVCRALMSDVSMFDGASAFQTARRKS